MNERIKDLYLNSLDDKQNFCYQKFAELIVRECCEVVKWTPSQYPNDKYVKNIKEHFGVE